MTQGGLRLLQPLAPVLLWAAFPASAAGLTAGEAYRHLANMAVEQGGVFDAETVADTGSEVRLSGVRIGVRKFPGHWFLTPEWMRLTERVDGAVEIFVPEAIPVEASVSGIHESAGTWLLSGFMGLIAESDEGVTVSMSGDSLQHFAVIRDLSHREERHLQSGLKTWRVGITQGSGSKDSVYATLGARMLDFAVLDGSGSFVFKGSFEAFRAESDGGFQRLFDLAADPFSIDWFRTAVSFASAEAAYSDDPGGGNYFFLRSGGFRSEVSSRPDHADISVTCKDFTLQTIDKGKVYDSVRAANVRLANEITVDRSSGTTEIAVKTDLSKVEINRHLLAMIGLGREEAGGERSFPPGQFALDGSLTVPSPQARKLFSGEQAEFQPSDIINWKLNALRLDFLGAALTAHGEVSQLAHGAPDFEFLEAGRLDVEIKGIKGVISALRSAGILNRRSEIAIRIMLSAGEPISEDHFGYRVIFSDNGDIVVNNFVVR